MEAKRSEDMAGWIETLVGDYLGNSPENSLENTTQEKAWEDFLVGFSRGDDPIFDAFKEHVGPFHWTPQEVFNQTFPENDATPEELIVISWVLVQTEATKRDNRKETEFPSERWARARIFGEKVNVNLRKHVVSALQKEGFQAVAPHLAPNFETKRSEKYGLASTWSERHNAYASGLGTFGLCDGLITPKGKAMRVGSVVARIQATSTPRLYKDHREYCLFLMEGLCGKCISRCPAEAISKNGHDKTKCRQYVKPLTEEYVKAHYGFDGYGCGLCQTGVPCESKIPTEEDL